MAAQVVGDDTETELGERRELLRPHPRRQGDAVREHDRRALAARERVEAPAVVAFDTAGLVEAHGRVGIAVGLGAMADPRDGHALARVRRAHYAGHDARDHTDPLEQAARVHESYRLGTRGPMPVTISYAIVPRRSAHSVAVTCSSP